MAQKDFDAIVVGSGPNGLAAAITLQQAGLSVLLVEGDRQVGGGARTAELTLPSFLHDVCAAVHPMAVASPFFSSLPLEDYGLRYLYPPIAAAHPFDDGTAAFLTRSVSETADALGADAGAYTRLVRSVVADWEVLAPEILAPLHLPRHPLPMARFGLKALRPAASLAKRFSGMAAKGLFAGMAAHSLEPLTNLSSAAIGLVLLAVGHVRGWPVVEGGSGRLSHALAAYFRSLGGILETGRYIESLEELPPARAVLLDVTPRQLLRIAGDRLSSMYTRQLSRYRYGMGVFKIDWALSEPIPFAAEVCRRAGTLHLGNTLEEIARSEQETWNGRLTAAPFVLLAQQSVFDPSRAPAGKHTAWAYCHVPQGAGQDRTKAIEDQVERFAPGFRDVILARHTMNASQMEAYNPNYVGGDINGGAMDIGQLFTRPALRLSPYRTSAGGVYLCSSSTPPGGGVHGMCGYQAARRALKDVFGMTPL